MTLGERIKQLRSELELSQPMLAETAAIEQSYLSKLENDKSLPSNEVFRRLLSALEQELDSFLNGFKDSYISTYLIKIPDVESWLLRKHSKSHTLSRRWLLSSSALIVVAITVFYAGYSAALFTTTMYSYNSKGIVLQGEPMDIFEGGLNRSSTMENFKERENNLKSRYAPKQLLLSNNRGELFTVEVEGGLRTYYRSSEESVSRVENNILQVLGVMLFCMGIMGFVLEAKFSSK